MRETVVVEEAATDPAAGDRPSESRHGRRVARIPRALRFDHWIKNLVVPVGILLPWPLTGPTHRAEVGAILLAFVVSGLVSSVNYAVNEILDSSVRRAASNEAGSAHPVRTRPCRAPSSS